MNALSRAGLWMLAALLPLQAWAACVAESGRKPHALVELYSSEGCSSCPPAERMLRSLPMEAGLVPLSLHVPYWDTVGWQDLYAQPAFATRQDALVKANGKRTVYTPHFFVAGREVSGWRDQLMGEVDKVLSRPARAEVGVEAVLASPGRLVIDATARADQGHAAVYLAVTESGLVSHVQAGENKGLTLEHDHVVRAWVGPLALEQGQLQVRREVALPADWKVAQLAVTAFVQDLGNSEVLQAVSTGQCLRP